MNIYDTLYKMSVKLRSGIVGKKIYDLLEIMGIRIVVSRFFNRRAVKYEEKHINSRIRESREYFKKNEYRVKNVERMLCDDESKNIYRSMIKFRCTRKYSDLPPNSMRKQYFDNNFFKYKEDGEIYIDCGAYDGDSIINFKRNMKRKNIPIKKIVAFEADKKNAELLKRNHADVKVLVAGVWDEDTTLGFSDGNTTTSHVDESYDNTTNNNSIIIQAMTIDNCSDCSDVTLLKMDIEGAEMHALEGARNTILKNRPKLAICIYHSDEDMIRIAEWIHDLIPNYKLYVRQHSNCIAETVLYSQMD